MLGKQIKARAKCHLHWAPGPHVLSPYSCHPLTPGWGWEFSEQQLSTGAKYTEMLLPFCDKVRGLPILHSSSTPGSGRALNNSWSLLHVLEALIFPGVPAHQRHTMAQSEHYKRCWPNGKDRGGEGTGARREAPKGHQGTGTTSMVLVNPEPGCHPVSTMTTSPFLKKPRALPTSMAKFT